MKSVIEVKKEMFATLSELQSNTASEQLSKVLRTRLSLLVDILEDDVPEEYYEQIDEELYKLR